MLDVTTVFVEDHDETLTLFHGDGDGPLQAVFVLVADLQFVYHHFDVVVLVTIHLHASRDLHEFTIDADIQVTLAAHRLEEFTVVTLTAAHQWGEDEDLLTRIVMEDHVEHLLLRVFHHLLTSGITVSLTRTGKEQTHIVVDLGGGTYRRTGVLVGGLLFDADDGREPCDLIDIRTFHATEEVTGVSREGLDIAALAFGEDGVEGQR